MVDLFIEGYQSINSNSHIEYIEADLIIWATPLYHHGMTSILKTFVERMLSLNEPYIVKKGEKFVHPERYNTFSKRNIVISNCGFPEYHNCDIMLQSFERITINRIDETVLFVMGELLSKKPLKGRVKWYFDTLKNAGVEFAKVGQFKPETRKLLHKPLVPIEDFIEMANLNWQAEGEVPPGLSDAMGENETVVDTFSKGFTQLKLMRQI